MKSTARRMSRMFPHDDVYSKQPQFGILAVYQVYKEIWNVDDEQIFIDWIFFDALNVESCSDLIRSVLKSCAAIYANVSSKKPTTSPRWPKSIAPTHTGQGELRTYGPISRNESWCG